MQIVIPMSGFGERFRKVGYKVPKPLIVVEGKPIIHHVIDMFSINDDSFVFICNENHLNNKEYQMEKVIKSYCPQAKIVSIPEHKKGPIFAVLESMDHISLSEPTIVNYCDFTCYWSYEAFKENIFKTNCDGSIPAYRGFHPHTLWNNNYAYLKEKESVVTDIQEKEPFTKDSNNEYAS